MVTITLASFLFFIQEIDLILACVRRSHEMAVIIEK
jgi:hypothetical protein